MTTHTRSDQQTAISVSMTRDLVNQVDQRAKALGLNRSQYLAMLAKADLAARGAMIINESPDAPPSPPAKSVNYKRRN